MSPATPTLARPTDVWREPLAVAEAATLLLVEWMTP